MTWSAATPCARCGLPARTDGGSTCPRCGLAYASALVAAPEPPAPTMPVAATAADPPPAKAASGASVAASAALFGLLLIGAGAVAAVGLLLPWLGGGAYLGGDFSITGLDLVRTDGESVERFYPAIAAAGGAVAVVAGVLHLATGRAWSAVLALAGGAAGAVVLGLFFASLRPDDPMWAFVGTRPVEMLSIGFWMTAGGDGAAILLGLVATVAAAGRRPSGRSGATSASR